MKTNGEIINAPAGSKLEVKPDGSATLTLPAGTTPAYIPMSADTEAQVEEWLKTNNLVQLPVGERVEIKEYLTSAFYNDARPSRVFYGMVDGADGQRVKIESKPIPIQVGGSKNPEYQVDLSIEKGGDNTDLTALDEDIANALYTVCKTAENAGYNYPISFAAPVMVDAYQGNEGRSKKVREAIRESLEKQAVKRITVNLAGANNPVIKNWSRTDYLIPLRIDEIELANGEKTLFYTVKERPIMLELNERVSNLRRFPFEKKRELLQDGADANGQPYYMRSDKNALLIRDALIKLAYSEWLQKKPLKRVYKTFFAKLGVSASGREQMKRARETTGKIMDNMQQAGLIARWETNASGRNKNYGFTIYWK